MTSETKERKEKKREKFTEDFALHDEVAITREPILSEEPIVETKESKSISPSHSSKIKLRELQESVKKYAHESTEHVITEIISLTKAEDKDGIEQILNQGYSIDLHYGFDTPLSRLGAQGDSDSIKWLMKNFQPGLNQSSIW